MVNSGYSLSFGVFQEYYTTHANFEASQGVIATVGTTLNGLMYLMSPISFTLLTRHPWLRPYFGPAGLVIAVGSLTLSSYATQIWQLIACQGVLCAIGSGLLYSSSTLYLEEWFTSRKGMAYGTIGAAKSAAGAIFPFLMSSLLHRYGPRTTLQAWAIALLVITTPLFFLMKPRVRLSPSTSHRPVYLGFLKHNTFWMVTAGNVVQGFGYLLPTTYLASYAHSLGYSSITGAILLAVFSLASVFGSFALGFLQDYRSSGTVTLISSFGSAISVFLFWGLAGRIPLLVVFAIIYGFFAGGFSSTYPGIVRELRRGDERVDTGFVMGLLLGGRGVGFVVGGPVSAALLSTGWRALEKAKWGYDTEYGLVIICTGASALLGSWACMWNFVRRVHV
jgi:MFS family permease